MNPVVVVRRFEDQDERRVQEIIRAYVLSKFKDAFWFCLFREVCLRIILLRVGGRLRHKQKIVIFPHFQITLQLVVLSTAIFFIFFGVPLLFCVSSVPIVVVLLARK